MKTISPATALVIVSLAAVALACSACSESGVAAPVLDPSGQDRSAELQIDIQVSPATITIDSAGTWVTIHAGIPLGDVDTASLSLNGIEPGLVKADSCGDLVAKFDRVLVVSIVSPPEATLTLSGVTKAGEAFAGSSTVVVQ